MIYHGLFLSLFLGLLSLTDTAFAARAAKAKAQAVSGCKSTITLPNGKFIYKQSAPLRSGGIGSPLIGYRIEPTLIGNYGAPGASSRITVHGKNGTQIGSCPKASAHGHSYRARCTMNTRSLANAAKRAGGSTAAYFKINSSQCVLVPDLLRCYGSVKGLCGRRL